MALPKLEVPTYELTLPSTNKVVKFRPFLVKEQKVLYVAQQDSENEQVISDAIGELVKNCTFDKVDPLISPVFDIEYIFLQLRSKSVGETIDIQVKCPDDNKTSVEVKINLKDVNVQMTTGHSNEVVLSDNMKIVLRYPILRDMRNVKGETEMDRVFDILSKCIHEVHHGDKIYNAIDVTEEDLKTFIEQMTTDQLEKIMDFFNTMPKLRHVVEVTNPNTKKKGEVIVEGLTSFLG